MKKTRKLTALLCVAMLASSLAACGGNGSTTSESTPAADNDASASTSETASEESVVTDPNELPDVTLPISEEPITITYFQTTDGNASQVKNDYNDLDVYQELEKRTNVHIEWQMSSGADTQTNFNLMISSNQLADVMYGASYYTDGIEAGIDDGYFLDLTELVPEYAPHYWAVAHTNDRYRKTAITDSGRIGVLWQFQQSEQGPWDGLNVRQDWLDELGLDVPVTYDDWHEVLTGFKDMGVYAPLSLMGNGSLDAASAFMSGFGVTYTWQLTEDGSVAYGPYLDGWKDYVALMADWYAEGLIDPDFMTANYYFGDTTMIVTGKTGAWTGMYTMPSLYKQTTEDPDMEISACTAPRVNEDDEIHLRLPDQRTSGMPHALSANLDEEKAQIILKWFDYLFTEEGALLCNYGIEGDTYTLDDSGNPVWTDKVLNSPDGYSFSQAQANYCMPPSSQPFWYDWTRELQGLDEESIAMMDVWAQDDMDWVMPSDLTLTADESVERASIMTDIDTFLKEQTAQMITGVLDVETNWDSYKSTIESMGIDRATEITQAAYDRYLAR